MFGQANDSAKAFIAGQVLDLWPVQNEADWDVFSASINAELELAADLHQRLLDGAKNELDGQQLKRRRTCFAEF